MSVIEFTGGAASMRRTRYWLDRIRSKADG